MIPTHIRRAAQRMLEELDDGYLEVGKFPGREGGYVRMVMSRNADWYRLFCHSWTMRRRYPYRKPRRLSSVVGLGERWSG